MGYNFLPSEISAAFAIEQIKKLRKNINTREKNFKNFIIFLKILTIFFELPTQEKHLKTAWLAFPLLIKESSDLKRKSCKFF